MILLCDDTMTFLLFQFYCGCNTICFAVIKLLLLLLSTPLQCFMAGSITTEFEELKMVSTLLFLQLGTDCILLLLLFLGGKRNMVVTSFFFQPETNHRYYVLLISLFVVQLAHYESFVVVGNTLIVL